MKYVALFLPMVLGVEIVSLVCLISILICFLLDIAKEEGRE